MGNAASSLSPDIRLPSDPWAWGCALAGVATAAATVKAGNAYLLNKRLRHRIAQVREKRVNNIKAIQKQLEANRRHMQDQWKQIQSLDFETLLEKLRTGELSSVAVLQAFQDKAIEVNEKTNSVVHFLECALEWARERDATPEEDRGSLHGLPISVKECYFIKGCDSTAGITEYTLNPCSSDALVVAQLKSFGAVPFCQTNVPQTTFSLQCSNPAYGATSNPHDITRDSGGSSGGEAALLAGGGSVLGIGSDLGGSLRNPAAMCGIYSLRPTYGRHLSQMGVRNPVDYELVGLSVVGGFMSGQVSAIVAAWKSMWRERSCDPCVVPIKWNEERFAKQKLRLGYFTHDGYVTPHPGCSRAVEEAVALLRAQGHEVVPFGAPDQAELFRLWLGFIYADEGKQVRATLSRDLSDGALVHVRKSLRLCSMPRAVQWAYLKAYRVTTKYPEFKPFSTAFSLQVGVTERDQLVLNYTQAMDEAGVDAVLMPAAYFPAPKHGTFGQGLGAGMGVEPYVAVNTMNVTSGIAPVTTVNHEDERKLESIQTSDSTFAMFRSATRNSVGLPLAVQIMARRYDEEIVLRVMAELEASRSK